MTVVFQNNESVSEISSGGFAIMGGCVMIEFEMAMFN